MRWQQFQQEIRVDYFNNTFNLFLIVFVRADNAYCPTFKTF